MPLSSSTTRPSAPLTRFNGASFSDHVISGDGDASGWQMIVAFPPIVAVMVSASGLLLKVGANARKHDGEKNTESCSRLSDNEID